MNIDQTPAEINDTTTDARKPWVAPVVRTMRAGDAEAGANPVAPEGPFADGS